MPGAVGLHYREEMAANRKRVSMPNRSTPWWMPIVACVLLPVILMALPGRAQDDEEDRPSPITIITPGEPIDRMEAEAAPTVGPRDCFVPLPVEIGQRIEIEVGVNIRAFPDGSSGIVWNTAYNRQIRDDEGVLQLVENAALVPAIVLEGPRCGVGYNWWRVDILEQGVDGWVAEGRPDREGYLFRFAGATAPGDACFSIYDISVGETATVTVNTRIRTGPNPQGSETVSVIPANGEVLILAGPECINGILRWFVRATVAGVIYEGWVSEGDGMFFWLVPDDLPNEADGTLCATPLSFAVGTPGEIIRSVQQPRNLRASPSLDAPLLFDLVNGTPFIIEGGPVCSNNLNWWRVRIPASSPVIGWIAEGSPFTGYWLGRRSADG